MIFEETIMSGDSLSFNNFTEARLVIFWYYFIYKKSAVQNICSTEDFFPGQDYWIIFFQVIIITL